jgi:hypothetical protein
MSRRVVSQIAKRMSSVMLAADQWKSEGAMEVK